jgi:hypothetical protein
MRPVYDGFREEFRMRSTVWAAVFLLGLGVGIVSGQAAQQSQPQPMPMGQMGGMETNPCKGMEI